MDRNSAAYSGPPRRDVKPQDSVGVRRRQRDDQRMQDYVLDRDWRANKDWNSQAELEASMGSRPVQQPNPQRQQRNKARALQWRKKRSQDGKQDNTAPPVDFSKYKATTESGARDEPLYDLVAGSRPVKRVYSQNCDLSGFPLLCETVHRDLKQVNPRIKRELPFCAFLHSMTSCLNAWLIQGVTKLNLEDRFGNETDAMSLIPHEMHIPQPIAEYLSMLNTVITPSGDTIRLNLPLAGVPQLTVPADGDKEMIPPGSFGEVTAQNHNAYECYLSPYVTRRFIEASVNEEHDYNPLPAGRFPPNATPTRNLLGYYPYERLAPEGRAILANYHFPETNDMAGRLQIVPAMLLETSNALFRCSKEYKMVKFHEIQRKPVPTPTIYSKLESTGLNNASDISRFLCNVHGPFAFSNATATQATLFTIKRERTARARGLCYVTVDNGTPAGWANTINANFTMQEPFEPLTGVDGVQFRSDTHQAFPPDGTREGLVGDWLKSFRISR